MKIKKSILQKLAIFAGIPVLIIVIYAGLVTGYISPMIKGLDIKIIGGTFITNINKYVIKVGDRVNISPGNYVVVPGFAKAPKLKFITLDDSGIVTIKGNKLIANREGYTSIGILNDNRVLKKVTIMVVNPTINNLEIELSRPLKYYGDTAIIKSTVSINEFKKLEEGYRLNYTTTNPKVLQIKGDEVKAVGIGDAKLIARYDRKEIRTDIKIIPKVEEILLNKKYTMEQGETLQISPVIKTLPEDKKTDVFYDIVEPVSKSDGYTKNRVSTVVDGVLANVTGLEVSKDGKLKANRPGRYLLKVKSQDETAFSEIDVKELPFEKIDIKNLQYRAENRKGKLYMDIGWDYNPRVPVYNVYIKKNGGKFELYDTIKKNNRVSRGGRINEEMLLDKGDGKYSYEIYIEGSQGSQKTRHSNIIKITDSTNLDYENKKVSDLRYYLDPENRILTFRWNAIGKDDISYRLYYSDRRYTEKIYRLMAKNIKKTNCTIMLEDKDLNYDFYIVAIDKNGQVSDFSEPISIKSRLSD